MIIKCIYDIENYQQLKDNLYFDMNNRVKIRQITNWGRAILPHPPPRLVVYLKAQACVRFHEAI